MSKKENSAPLDEEKEAVPAGEAEEVQESAPETFTVTKEQMEQMEQMEALAQQLAGQNDKYLRLAAEYDNYRKRRWTSSSASWRSMTTWSGRCSRRETRKTSTKRAWR